MAKHRSTLDRLIELKEIEALHEVMKKGDHPKKPDDKPKKWYHDKWAVVAVLLLAYPIVGPLYWGAGQMAAILISRILTQH